MTAADGSAVRDDLSGVSTKVSSREFFGDPKERRDIYAMTDEVSEEEYDVALSVAKEEHQRGLGHQGSQASPDERFSTLGSQSCRSPIALEERLSYPCATRLRDLSFVLQTRTSCSDPNASAPWR